MMLYRLLAVKRMAMMTTRAPTRPRSARARGRWGSRGCRPSRASLLALSRARARCGGGGGSSWRRRQVRLSRDHKPDVASERSRIEKAGGYVVQVGHYITLHFIPFHYTTSKSAPSSR